MEYSIKLFLTPTILILMLMSSIICSQTVKLGEIEVSIGDSLSELTSQIDTNYYSFNLSKPEKMEQTGILSRKEYPERGYLVESLLAVITFFAPDYGLEKSSQHTILSIQKYWSWDDSNAIDVMKKFYSLLDKYGIDKYDEKIDYKKDVEPNYTSYTIEVKTNSWHYIVLNFNNTGVTLSEYFSKNEHQFDSKIYYLFFDDYKHYTNKNSNLIIEKFDDEKKAEKRERMLKEPYLARFIEVPKSDIIRVWRNSFNFDNNNSKSHN